MTSTSLAKRAFILALATLICAGVAMAQANTAAPDNKPPDILENMKFRNLGPAAGGGRVAAVAGIPGNANVYYVGAAAGGVWKTTDGGLDLESDFRETADGLDRGDRAGAVQSQPGVGGNGRIESAQRRGHGQGSVLFAGCGRELEVHGPGECRADFADRGAPDESGHCLCRRARARVGAECGPRRLSHHGWRQDLAEGPLRGRQDGRQRPGDGPVEPDGAVRRDVGVHALAPGCWRAAAISSGIYRSTDGGSDLEKIERGIAQGAAGADRTRGGADQRQSRLRADRCEEGNAVGLDRPGRALEAGEFRSALHLSRVLLHHPVRVAGQRKPPLLPVVPDAGVARRRQVGAGDRADGARGPSLRCGSIPRIPAA